MNLIQRTRNHQLQRDQKLLLRASLLQGKEALDAWQQWSTEIDIDTLDSESYHLLCLLYRNLSLHQVQDELMQRLKSVYRRHWYANNLLIKEAKDIVQSFQSNSIRALALADTGLISNYYQDLAERSIYRLDFLVQPSDIPTAIRLVNFSGWVLNSSPTANSLHFQNSSRHQLWLHQHIFWSVPGTCIEHELWKHSISGRIGDCKALVLSPTEQLLFVCSKINRRHQVPQVRWLADAVKIIQMADHEIDWNRLLAQSQQCQLILPLRNMVFLLQNILDIQFPDWVLSKLDKLPISKFELLEYQFLPPSTIVNLTVFMLRVQRRINRSLYNGGLLWSR